MRNIDTLIINDLGDGKLQSHEINALKGGEALSGLSCGVMLKLAYDIKERNKETFDKPAIQDLYLGIINNVPGIIDLLINNNMISGDVNKWKNKLSDMLNTSREGFVKFNVLNKFLLLIYKHKNTKYTTFSLDNFSKIKREDFFDSNYIQLIYDFQKFSKIPSDCLVGKNTFHRILNYTIYKDNYLSSKKYKGQRVIINKPENLRCDGNIECIDKVAHPGEQLQIIDNKIVERVGNNGRLYHYVKVTGGENIYLLCIDDQDRVYVSKEKQNKPIVYRDDINKNSDTIEKNKSSSKYKNINIDGGLPDMYSDLKSALKAKNSDAKLSLCTSFTMTTALDGLYSKGLQPTYFLDKRKRGNINEFDARETGLVFPKDEFKNVTLYDKSPEDARKILLSAPKYSIASMQYQYSSYLNQGVTHTMVHMGGGIYKDMFGDKIRTININKKKFLMDSNKASYFTIKDSKGVAVKYTFVLGPGKAGSPTGNACIIMPQIEKIAPLNQLRKIELLIIDGQTTEQAAESCMLKYGLTKSYRYSLISDAIIDSGYRHHDLTKLDENEKRCLQLKAPLSSSSVEKDKLGYKEDIYFKYTPGTKKEKKKFEQRKKSQMLLSNKYGYTISDEKASLLMIINKKEKGGGWKRNVAEFLSANTSLGISAEIVGIQNRPRSYGAFELQIAEAEKLLKNKKRVKFVNKILKDDYSFFGSFIKQGSSIKDIKSVNSLGYNQRIYILSNPIISMYLASEKLTTARQALKYNGREYINKTNEKDLYLTMMYEYNHGLGNTYAAILQQYIYRVAIKKGYNATDSLIVDGKGGTQMDNVINFLNSENINIKYTSYDEGNIKSFFLNEKEIGRHDYSLVNEFVSGYDISYTPFLQGDFLDDCKKCIKLQYAYALNEYSEDIDVHERKEKYDGIDGQIEDKFLGSILNFKNSYPIETLGRLKSNDMRYDVGEKSSNLNCNYFISLYALRNSLRERKINGKDIFDQAGLPNSIHKIFEKGCINNYNMSPQMYGNYASYLNVMKNIKPGMILGIGHSSSSRNAGTFYLSSGKSISASMSHGGVVSRVVRNHQGDVVNIYMMHASGTPGKGGDGVTETLLFGPDGYYEKSCQDNNQKNNIYFGELST